jgi:hypothetical protein
VGEESIPTVTYHIPLSAGVEIAARLTNKFKFEKVIERIRA